MPLARRQNASNAGSTSIGKRPNAAGGNALSSEQQGPAVNRSALLFGVAAVLGGTSVLLFVLGAVFNLLFVVLAVPFAAAAYFLWLDATGRLANRFRWKRRTFDDRRRTARRTTSNRRRQSDAESPSRSRAREVLGVGPEADQAEIRSAYRNRVKEVHPDADGGDEEAFKRLSAAYDRLRD